MNQHPADRPSRLARVIAVVGLLAAGAAFAVAVGVDRIERTHSYSDSDSGGVKYTGVFTERVETPWRVPVAVISVAVLVLAVLVLSRRFPRFRRATVGLLLAGDVLLLLWLGGLLISYIEIWGIRRGIMGIVATPRLPANPDAGETSGFR